MVKKLISAILILTFALQSTEAFALRSRSASQTQPLVNDLGKDISQGEASPSAFEPLVKKGTPSAFGATVYDSEGKAIFNAAESPESIIARLKRSGAAIYDEEKAKKALRIIQKYFRIINFRDKDNTQSISDLNIEFRRDIKNYAYFKDETICIDIDLLNLPNIDQEKDLVPFLAFVLGHEGSHSFMLKEKEAQGMDMQRFAALSQKHRDSIMRVLVALGAEKNYLESLKAISANPSRQIKKPETEPKKEANHKFEAKKRAFDAMLPSLKVGNIYLHRRKGLVKLTGINTLDCIIRVDTLSMGNELNTMYSFAKQQGQWVSPRLLARLMSNIIIDDVSKETLALYYVPGTKQVTDQGWAMARERAREWGNEKFVPLLSAFDVIHRRGGYYSDVCKRILDQKNIKGLGGN